MRAFIYQPAKTAMSSGTARTGAWVLEFAKASRREVEPLMGWTSSDDMKTQVRMRFPSKDAALDYARAHAIDAIVTQPRSRKLNIRPGGYSENFATDRRSVWTH